MSSPRPRPRSTPASCRLSDSACALPRLASHAMQPGALSAVDVTEGRSTSDSGGRRSPGHHRSKAWMHFQNPLRDQLRHHFVRRIGVDLERLAQRAHGGKRLARAHLARDHRLLGGVDHLLAEGDARLKGDAERDHMCTITYSTRARTRDEGRDSLGGVSSFEIWRGTTSVRPPPA